MSAHPLITPAPQRRVRALAHLLRSPLTAARLRLRLAGHQQGHSNALSEVEAALVTLDAAVARLLPLATGATPNLARLPSDLVAIVLSTMRSCGVASSLQTPATLPGRWDGFAVSCIVRNLLSLARDRPTRTMAVTLTKVPDGAMLVLVGSAAAPPSDDARRWLIQRLVRAHGGSASLTFEPGRFNAQVFLAGYNPVEG